MAFSLDHVVIVVRDLARAISDYELAGLTVTPGGEHPDRGTHNALIPFADGAYLELIAFKDPDRPHDDPWWRRLARGEGLTDYALLASDLAADAAVLRQRGLAVVGPTDGGRLRLDGQRLAWRILRVAEDGAPAGVLPFLIEDVTPREWRVPGGEATRHRLGATGVAGLRVAVADLEEMGGALARFLGVTPAVTAVTGLGLARRFLLGRHWIEFVQPVNETSAEAALARAQGDGPFELTLVGGAGSAGGPLAGGLHGARILLAP